jgi:hypothetical protein
MLQLGRPGSHFYPLNPRGTITLEPHEVRNVEKAVRLEETRCTLADRMNFGKAKSIAFPIFHPSGKSPLGLTTCRSPVTTVPVTQIATMFFWLDSFTCPEHALWFSSVLPLLIWLSLPGTSSLSNAWLVLQLLQASPRVSPPWNPLLIWWEESN